MNPDTLKLLRKTPLLDSLRQGREASARERTAVRATGHQRVHGMKGVGGLGSEEYYVLDSYD